MALKETVAHLPATALQRPFPVFHPTWHGKICRLGTIEPMIKARMIPKWQQNH